MRKKDYRIHSVPRTFEQVAKQIADYIKEEQLTKGSQLPPERKLCELLQVSRSSVREGLRVLELLKYLDSRHGGGTFVAEAPPYLLPALLLEQKLDRLALDHHFEIAIMAAEKIVFLNMGQPLETKQLENQDSWPEFSAFISSLGRQLENPYYLTLWTDTYEVLLKNDYFVNKDSSLPLDEFISFFNAEDSEQLRSLFSTLSTQ